MIGDGLVVGIIIISHGKLAEGLKDAIEMIIGPQTQFKTLGLFPEDNPDDFRDAIETSIKEIDDGEGVLIFADLFGGSPANAATYLLRLELQGIEIVTGFNLPMILEIINLRQDSDLKHLAKICKPAALQGIQQISGFMTIEKG